MIKYGVTIEDYAGRVWEGTITRDELEINDYVRIRLWTKAPRYAEGVVIMFHKISEEVA